MKTESLPKFKPGELVIWDNGVYQAYFIHHVHPLHAPGACFHYRLSKVVPRMRPFISTLADADYVCEEVLRRPTKEELGQ